MKKGTGRKVQKKKAVAVKEPQDLTTAYTITDPAFGEFAVRTSANAWWMEPIKVHQLIEAFKFRATHIQARVHAGITEMQLRYFLDQHPEFYQVIDACKEVPGLAAKKTLMEGLEKDLPTVRWFLESTEPDDFGKKPPMVAVQVNMADSVAKDREAYS